MQLARRILKGSLHFFTFPVAVVCTNSEPCKLNTQGGRYRLAWIFFFQKQLSCRNTSTKKFS